MISKEEVQNLATLARVEVSEGEVESLQKDISNILEYISQIQAAPMGEVDTRPLQRNVLRDDTVRSEGDAFFDKREALLAALPKREGDYNVVRKIIQKDE